MQGDISYRFVAQPLKRGGYYIWIQREKNFSSLADKNLKSRPKKKDQALPKALRQAQHIDAPERNKQSKHAAFAKENVQFIGELTRSKILAAGDPIRLGAEAQPEERDPHRIDVPMGTLILRNSPPGKLFDLISHHEESEQFEVVYRRSRSGGESADAQQLRVDDAAILVRVFMLAKIATARLEMRAALSEVAIHRSELLKYKTAIAAKTDSAAKTAARRGLEALLHKLESTGHAQPGAHAAGPSMRVRIENFLAMRMEATQHWLGGHRNAIYWLAFIGLGLTLFWVWQPYLSGHHSSWSGYLGWTLVAALAAGGALFLLNALNLKSLELRIEEKIHEETIERLNATLASLVQTNANVAAIHTKPKPAEGFPSELLLHNMDLALHIKERLVSIERIIKAREVHLSSSISHIEEHRDGVRRSIMAAGSGVFVGFFTYEVGESLMDYLHVAHQQDTKAMLYWLIANRDHVAHRAKAEVPVPPVPALPQPVPQPKLPAHAGQEAAHTIALDSAFVDNYHRPELYAQSWLLTITIVVSVLTAWIAVRKPAAEQGAGHAHH